MIGVGLCVKNSIEAVGLYKKVFGLELGYHVNNPDGTYFHSELLKDGEAFVSVVESPDDRQQDNTVQLGVEFNSEDDVKKAFSLLCEGGTIDFPVCELPWSPCAASVIDRFGVWWYLTVKQHQPAENYDYWSDTKN